MDEYEIIDFPASALSSEIFDMFEIYDIFKGNWNYNDKYWRRWFQTVDFTQMVIKFTQTRIVLSSMRLVHCNETLANQTRIINYPGYFNSTQV